MADGGEKIGRIARELEQALAAMSLSDPVLRDAVERSRADLAALRFHVGDPGQAPLIAILGGTGTGKSTLLNRLVGQTISATSYRRTYTAGPIAVTPDVKLIPADWLGVEHVVAHELPARGTPQQLIIVPVSTSATSAAPWVLIDTPDLDGDTPAHHAAADRVFRWVHGLVFVVTPEKYQMTELLPYYRLARRYGLAAWFVMNKTEHPEAVEDYRAQLAERDWPAARLYAIERDDSTFTPPAEQTLEALRQSLAEAARGGWEADRKVGLANRKADLVSRLSDHVLAPLRDIHTHVERLTRALHALEQPTAQLDVNPLTEQLRVRLQQRSILYLMGPQRMWDRVRQLPGLMLRLPRSIWNAARGERVELPDPEPMPVNDQQAPDFAAALCDQFAAVQSRIEDVLRSDPVVGKWLDAPERQFLSVRIDPADAGKIADEEVEALRQWLQKRWDSHPRDTLLVMKVLRYLPGGQRVTRAVEAAPYLLLIFFVLHPGHAVHELLFGLGYAAVASLIERLSNEVSQRTRATNKRIADRFAELAHRQIEQVIAWLGRQATSAQQLSKLETLTARLAES